MMDHGTGGWGLGTGDWAKHRSASYQAFPHGRAETSCTFNFAFPKTHQLWALPSPNPQSPVPVFCHEIFRKLASLSR